MKSRRIKKCVTVLILVISLIAVQTLELTAMAATETPDLSNPFIIVSNFSDLQYAIDTASDGTVIGIDSLIPIDSANVTLGSEDGSKHVYIVRMNPDAYLWITQITNLTICNVTLDGNSSQVVGYNPMLYVDGTLNLNNSVVQNHVNTSFGAIQITDCGTFNATATVFQNNSAVKGGHIENDGTTYLNGCSLQNGSAQEMGGAIYNGKSLTIENCKITGNQAGKLGGAIYNRDVLSISQSVIYSNTALFGNDFANDVNYTLFSNNDIAEVQSLYEAEGVIPVEWRYDGPATAEEAEQAGVVNINVFDSQSLLKLVLSEGASGDGGEDEGAGDTGDGENDGDGTEDGGTTGDDTGDDGTGDVEDSGSTGDTEDEGTTGENDNTEGGGTTEDSGDTENGENTGDTDNSNDTGSDEEGSDTDNTGDNGNTENGGNTGTGSEENGDSDDSSDSGNQDSSTDNSGDNSSSNNQDNNTSDGIDNNGTQNDGSDDAVSGGDVTNNYDQSTTTTTTTTTEDNSSVSNTDTYEDKSSTTTTTTTTNNYYTYNTPQSPNATGNVGGAKTNNTTASTGVATQKTEAVSENSTAGSTNVQLPDNLTLDLHGVDVSYEVVDGVPKITISNEKITEQVITEQTSAELTTQPIQQEAVAENTISTASVTADSESTSASINWYEIIKMILLAAILVVVIYKPSGRKSATPVSD